MLKMEVARITTKGQITIPIEIRKKLNLKEGDKIIFFEQDGRIYFENAALLAFNRIQKSMSGEAQKAGYNTPEEMNDLVKEIRKELWEERYENND
jgi:antitoxin PrlF